MLPNRLQSKGQLIKSFHPSRKPIQTEIEKSNNISSQNLTSDTMTGCTLRENKAT
jgi:hypothetical protein